ncbi:MAG TPA: PQQ-binding-like beta-propeller repeat protein [Planctomycetota bacterium]|nr:PQQ-binding-like beta-propeller repeat protein [Planctomycetota bacterium]
MRTLLLALVPLAGPVAQGDDDWPMWRRDPERTGSSPAALPHPLRLQWVRELPPPRPAWPDQTRLPFDAVDEPVVAGGTLFVGSSRTDRLFAFDVRTGALRWSFFADGPVRFPAAVWEGRVYFVSDDGRLRCLDAERGALLWSVRGGPSDRRVLGHERLVSSWPARGAPVVADGVVYFAAGIWPFMGTFLHAVDARTGRVLWTNDGDGALYIPQPHNADAFAGVAPQGPLAVSGEWLLVPGGRSVPACYDRRTGRLVHFRLAEGNRKGGFDVTAAGRVYFCGGSMFDRESGLWVADLGRPLVAADGDVWWADRKEGLRRLALPSAIEIVETKDRRGRTVRRARARLERPDEFDGPRVEALLRAGPRLYAGTEGRLYAVDLEDPERRVWEAPIEGAPLSLAAAGGRLFAATKEGRIYCFGAENRPPAVHPWRAEPLGETPAGDRARRILQGAGVREGYAAVWGLGDGDLVVELVRQSGLRILAVDPDPVRVAAFRGRLAAAGLYGDRVEAHVGDPCEFPWPPYGADLAVADEALAAGTAIDGRFAEALFRLLRPYGGTASFPADAPAAEAFSRFVRTGELREREAEGRRIFVRGPLPGAADWTHEHADAANTRVSRDRIVKAPLGLLWFGGPSNEGILPRHGHGPQPQVIEGRLLIEGVDKLRALDIYTGRLLWEAPLPGVGKFFDNTLHQPGANASGTNFISTRDGIYVAYGRSCVKLDPATGARIGEFTLPPGPHAKDPPLWGYINVVGDYLIGGAEPLGGHEALRGKTPEGGDDPDDDDDDLFMRRLLHALGDQDAMSSSRRLAVLDRFTGKPLWTAEARSGFRHNAVCAGGGRLYAIDRLSGMQAARLKRDGAPEPPPPRLVVFDLATGRVLWETEEKVFGTWLSYSEEHDVLVEAGRVARDTLKDEPRGMRARRGADGRVLWERREYSGPAMIRGGTVFMADRACDLRTGEPLKRVHPVTLESVPWTWTRNYGCNTPMASEHLLTFRSGAAGYFDLARDGGTGNLGGFRSGCTNNLVVAGGLLVAPDYTRTCTCSYQNQGSLALVPMPENEMWTFFGSTDLRGRVRRLGLNFGAPGDRKADDGTLWLEWPSVAGKSPAVQVRVEPEEASSFRRHSSAMGGEGPAWVVASGLEGLESVTVTLDPAAREERPYTVRLFFAEPGDRAPGERIFDVALQGRPALAGFDVVREAGGPRRGVVREFRGVKAARELAVEFRAREGRPLLCGLEVIEEGAPLLKPAEGAQGAAPAAEPAGSPWGAAMGAGIVALLTGAAWGAGRIRGR